MVLVNRQTKHLSCPDVIGLERVIMDSDSVSASTLQYMSYV
jgi:hypothetical protein